MTSRGPLLTVTLTSRTPKTVVRGIEEVASEGGDIAEIRFDRWSPADLGHLGELNASKLPLLATYRSRSQGGEGVDDPAQRSRVFRTLAGPPFAYLDLEVRTNHDLVQEMSNRPPACRLVLSHHSPRVDRSELRELTRILRPGPDSILRIAVTARTSEVIQRILPLIREMPPPYAVMTLGPSGPLLRAWSAGLGCALVYCSPSGVRPDSPVEPSQIPVDLLRRFQGGPAGAPLFAVVGNPVDHSRSPHLHNRWIRADGRAGMYLALGVADEEELKIVAPALAERGFRGLNVTHPLKFAAYRMATSWSPEAQATECANTLTFEKGSVHADNTDVGAIRRRVRELSRQGHDVSHVAILGTGGAARATLAATRELGLAAEILGRNGLRTSELAREFGASVMSPSRRSRSPLVVHATPVGREGSGTLPWALENLVGPETYVLDFVYRPDDLSIPSTVRRLGGTYEDGFRLLVYQAAESYARWWGSAPSPQQITRSLEEAT